MTRRETIRRPVCTAHDRYKGTGELERSTPCRTPDRRCQASLAPPPFRRSALGRTAGTAAIPVASGSPTPPRLRPLRTDTQGWPAIVEFLIPADQRAVRPWPADSEGMRGHEEDYSAGVAAGCPPDSFAPALANCSSSQRLWCSFAQFRSTVPSLIASNAPSMPSINCSSASER
jgi:hypothetical protein